MLARALSLLDRRTLIGTFAIALVSMICARCGAEPPHIFLDSRSTTLDPTDAHAELMLREIPRQTLLAALEQDLKQPCTVRDATLEPAAKPQPGEMVVGIERKLDTTGRPWKLTLRLLDGQNHVLDETVLDTQWSGAGSVQYEGLVDQVDQVLRTKWLGLVARQLSATTRPATAAADWELPAHVDDWLNIVDFHHAFLAARLLHAAIARKGESPESLCALARAYANLGESSRHLWNGQSTAFFARALVYAQRLADIEPDSARTWWTRGYVQTLLGENLNALRDFGRVDKLKGPKPQPPEWVGLVQALNHFDTLALDDKIGASKSPLASYFAFLTVEYSMLPSLPINYARAALAQDPFGLRLEQAIGDNGGVGLNHQVTEESPRILNRMAAQLATEADDQAARDAAAAAGQQRFALPAIIQLRAALEAQPLEAGQPLPWSTYAAFLRECEFINALNRLYFVAYAWAIDPGNEIQQWLPLVSDHRYAPLLAAITFYNQPANPDLLKKAAAIQFKDDVRHCRNVPALFAGLGLTAKPEQYLAFANREYRQDDGTSWDHAREVWEYQEAGDKAYLSSELNYLSAISPEHPLCLAQSFIDQWPRKSRVADTWLKKSRNPIISYGIAEAYIQNNQPDKAIAALQDIVRMAPDLNSYRALANAYLAENDEKSWLKTWDDYLKNVEDLGLDHAAVGQTVARRLNWHQRSDEALPYAKIAADSYSASGLQIYAWTLADVRQYDQAAAVMEEEFERYNDPPVSYRFFVTIGRGNRDGTAKAYPQWFANSSQHDDPFVKMDYAIYLMLEGQTAQADAMLHQAFDQKPARLIALLLAVRALEQNKPADIQAIFAKAQASAAQSDIEARYDLCIAEFERCLKDPSALPARDGRLAASFADWNGAGQNVASAYAMGRLCELRNKPDDARWWYHQAFIYPQDDYGLRPLSAVALRRLGDDPYK